MAKSYAVYILASRKHGTVYVGVTSDLPKRIWQHRTGKIEGFTKQHGVHRLVWYEVHRDVATAIQREKRIKRWRRDWKANLIERDNPDWADLYPGLFGATAKQIAEWDEQWPEPSCHPDFAEGEDRDP